jgi:predicted dinucleotide-binding enzyme
MKKIAITFFCTAAMFCGFGCKAAEMETVAMIGTGDMGDSLGPRFAELGYRVVYGSRKPESDKVKALVKKTGKNASAATQMEAAQRADIVVTAVPWPE